MPKTKLIGIYSPNETKRVAEVAWLLANVWDFMERGGSLEEVRGRWSSWVGRLGNLDVVGGVGGVCLEDFGSHLKGNAEALVGRELEDIFVNIKTLDVRKDCFEVSSPRDIRSRIEVEGIEKVPEDEAWLSARDFIIFYAQVLRKYFGEDVFINSVRAWEHKLIQGGDTRRIYYDVKTDAEQDFIKSYGGVLLELRLVGGKLADFSQVKPNPDVILEFEMGDPNLPTLLFNIISSLP